MKKLSLINYLKTFILLILAAISTLAANAVSLPAIFSDNMVLQQNAEVKIFGFGKPLENIHIKAGWSDQSEKVVVDNHGRWMLVLKTPKAGGPYDIAFQGHNQFSLKNVMIGEVWLCSGQSNMEWTASQGIDDAAAEIEKAGFPDIRFFSVEHRTAEYPQSDIEGTWNVCSAETMRNFSAAAYFFARKLHLETGVPVGVINASWGGSAAESWVPAKVIDDNPLLAEASKKIPVVAWCPNEPGVIYNAMLAPLTRFRIAGALWYQGEANTANPLTYKELLSTLIKSWRELWGYDFPFYYAQIAPFKHYGGQAGVLVRDAQRRALEVPNTGMVVTSDIGDTNDIHPKNKLDVGLRFANLALKNHYLKPGGEVSGPLYRSFKVEKNAIRIFFDHAEGLEARGEKLTDFEIAGKDGVFYPGTASIENNSVVVSSAEVRQPAAVRFAWRNAATPNLFNGAGLPASCFTTE